MLSDHLRGGCVTSRNDVFNISSLGFYCASEPVRRRYGSSKCNQLSRYLEVIVGGGCLRLPAPFPKLLLTCFSSMSTAFVIVANIIQLSYWGQCFRGRHGRCRRRCTLSQACLAGCLRVFVTGFSMSAHVVWSCLYHDQRSGPIRKTLPGSKRDGRKVDRKAGGQYRRWRKSDLRYEDFDCIWPCHVHRRPSSEHPQARARINASACDKQTACSVVVDTRVPGC